MVKITIGQVIVNGSVRKEYDGSISEMRDNNMVEWWDQNYSIRCDESYMGTIHERIMYFNKRNEYKDKSK
jgi:hypothetical protein